MDHDNLSPPLEWSGVPEAAVDLAVLCEDPDAPGGRFVHWGSSRARRPRKARIMHWRKES